jgi:hypothetical protein
MPAGVLHEKNAQANKPIAPILSIEISLVTFSFSVVVVVLVVATEAEF